MIKFEDIDRMSEERYEEILVDYMDTIVAKHILKTLETLVMHDHDKKRKEKE